MKIKYPGMDDPRWIEGKCEPLEPGMFIKHGDMVELVGDCLDRELGHVDDLYEHDYTHYIPVGAIEVE